MLRVAYAYSIRMMLHVSHDGFSVGGVPLRLFIIKQVIIKRLNPNQTTAMDASNLSIQERVFGMKLATDRPTDY